MVIAVKAAKKSPVALVDYAAVLKSSVSVVARSTVIGANDPRDGLVKEVSDAFRMDLASEQLNNRAKQIMMHAVFSLHAWLLVNHEAKTEFERILPLPDYWTDGTKRNAFMTKHVCATFIGDCPVYKNTKDRDTETTVQIAAWNGKRAKLTKAFEACIAFHMHGLSAANYDVQAGNFVVPVATMCMPNDTPMRALASKGKIVLDYSKGHLVNRTLGEGENAKDSIVNLEASPATLEKTAAHMLGALILKSGAEAKKRTARAPGGDKDAGNPPAADAGNKAPIDNTKADIGVHSLTVLAKQAIAIIDARRANPKDGKRLCNLDFSVAERALFETLRMAFNEIHEGQNAHEADVAAAKAKRTEDKADKSNVQMIDTGATSVPLAS